MHYILLNDIDPLLSHCHFKSKKPLRMAQHTCQVFSYRAATSKDCYIYDPGLDDWDYRTFMAEGRSGYGLVQFTPESFWIAGKKKPFILFAKKIPTDISQKSNIIRIQFVSTLQNYVILT